MSRSFITIFTPTYNRVHTLPKLWKSLSNQTSKNFEWLIVDDGSTDNTQQVVEQWIRYATFPIRYHYQQNAGKMAAHNKGVKLANGELFVCIDSDDYISNDCVELIENEWTLWEQRDDIAGILAYKRLINGHNMPFPNIDCLSMLELHKSGFTGDTTIIIRTDVFKQYPFPILKGEKFILEGYVYNQISQNYKMRIFPQYLTICEYMPDGYSNNIIKLQKNYPGGWALCAQQSYGYSSKLSEKIKNMARFIAFSRQFGYSSKRIIKDSPNKVICILCYPLGIYVDLKKRIAYKSLTT